MRALLGVVPLLVALAIVGLIVVKQLKAVGSVSAAATAPAGLPALSSGGTLREPSQALQQKVEDDVRKALEQAAAARAEQADK